MAKAIENTPILKGKDAERFLNIISNVENISLTSNEKNIKIMIQKMPKHLKINPL